MTFKIINIPDQLDYIKMASPSKTLNPSFFYFSLLFERTRSFHLFLNQLHYYFLLLKFLNFRIGS